MSGYCKGRLKLCQIGVAAVALTSILLTLCGSGPANADLSSTTQQFYGYVYNNDALVPGGYTITALVGATKVGETYTDIQGRYGYDPVFEVTASPGQTVNFSINDHPSLQRVVFQGGIATNLNLTAYGAASQMPSTTCRTCGALGCSTACGISPITLPTATVGIPYSVDLTAHGGVLPYTWSISGGTLPDGLTMDSVFGVIKGVPATALTYSFTVRVDDSGLNYLTMETSIQVKTAGPSSQPSVAQGSVLTSSITTNFLGTTDVINISNNALPEARELASGDGRVRLNLPAGTVFNLKGNSVISAGSESNPPPSNDGSISECSYSFGPAGATFSPSATMTLRYQTPLSSGLTESGLYIAYWDGAAWNKLDSAVNTSAKEVTASVSHFTIFAVRGLPAASAQPPAASAGPVIPSSPVPSSGTDTSSSTDSQPATMDFVFSDLNVTPDTVMAGEKVTISVLAVNGGPSNTTGNVDLKINGEDQTRQKLTLEKGTSQPVKFSVTESAPGIIRPASAG